MNCKTYKIKITKDILKTAFINCVKYTFNAIIALFFKVWYNILKLSVQATFENNKLLLGFLAKIWISEKGEKYEI